MPGGVHHRFAGPDDLPGDLAVIPGPVHTELGGGRSGGNTAYWAGSRVRASASASARQRDSCKGQTALHNVPAFPPPRAASH